MGPDLRQTSDVSTNPILDRRYDRIRNRYGTSSGRANGYQSESFFRRERAALLTVLTDCPDPVVDLACGSGLMLLPMQAAGRSVFGLDFNDIACRDALVNGLLVSRGSVFALPFEDASIGTAVNCQFLNQQTDGETAHFIGEAARVLRPGGRLVIFWRHADSRLHRMAGTLIDTINRIRAQPRFPQFRHSMEQIEQLGAEAGLRAVRKSVTLPWGRAAMISPECARARWIGASLVVVFEKPDALSGGTR